MQLNRQRRQRARATKRLLFVLTAVVLGLGGIFLSINGFALYRSNTADALKAAAESKEKALKKLHNKLIKQGVYGVLN